MRNVVNMNEAPIAEIAFCSSGPDIDDIKKKIAIQAEAVLTGFESSKKKRPRRVSENNNDEELPKENARVIRSQFHSPIATFTQMPCKTLKITHNVVEEAESVSHDDNKSRSDGSGLTRDIKLNSDAEEIQISHNDVVFGRGKTIENLVGNRRYQVWIDLHRQGFSEASNDDEKKKIVKSIINAVQGSTPAGRFISFDISSGLWQEVGCEGTTNLVMADLVIEAMLHTLKC